VELSEIGQASLGLVERVETAIKTKLGASAKITILASKSLPVTEGKTKRVMRTYK
jgi:phenylacetate-CoA ligase